MQFPGAGILADHLAPTSLEARKRQLAQQIAQGQGGATHLSLGAGMGDAHGSAPGLSFNPFMTGYLQALGHGDPSGQSAFFNAPQFAQQGGDPSGPPTVDAPAQRQLFDPRVGQAPPGPPPGNPATPPGITGGINPYLGFDPATIMALASSLRPPSNTFQAA